MSAPPPPPPPGWQPTPPPAPAPQPPGWQAPAPGWQSVPGATFAPGYPSGPAGPPSGVHADGRPKGLPPAVSLGLLIAAIVVAGVAAFFVIRAAVETLTDGETIDVPGEATVDLDGGGWRVYRQDGSFGVPGVTITGPSSELDVRSQPFGTSETLEVDGRSYTAIGRFDVEAAGPHTVEVTGEPGSGRIRIGRPVTHMFSQWPWMIVGSVAGVTLLVASVLTFFSFRNRGRARRYAS